MNKVRSIRLGSGREIGQGPPCFVVAEIGNNHQGEMKLARELVDAAADAGCDAVKFQKRNMEALLTRAGRAAPYTGCNSFGPTYGEHRDALELSISQMAELKGYAEERGLVFFASAWDEPSLEEVLDLGVELVKVASAELVNVPYLRRLARARVPVVLSTGMSSLEDITIAVDEIREVHDNLVLLHCNSRYPCPDEQIGLPVIETLRETFGLPVGYSGHERGMGPSVAAVAFGACVVERHITLDRTLRGTDHQVSLEPGGLKAMVDMIREVEQALRIQGKKVFPEEKTAARKLRKCVVFARDLPAGHVLTEADLTTRCPMDGVSPVHWDEIVGATLKGSVCLEEPVQWEMVSVPRQDDGSEAASS